MRGSQAPGHPIVNGPHECDYRTALAALVAAWEEIGFYNSGTEHEPIESLSVEDYLKLEAAFDAAARRLIKP